jgi:hypothetical protein
MEKHAINDLWNPKSKNTLGCFAGAHAVILKASLDLAKRYHKSVNAEIRNYFTRKGYDSEFWGKLEEADKNPATAKKGYQAKDLLPGDLIWFQNIWFQNPYYALLTPTEKDDSAFEGEQGSNLFYMGKGKVIGLYPTHDIKTIAAYQDGMKGWNSVEHVLANPEPYYDEADTEFPELETLFSSPKATDVFRIMTKIQPKAYLP